MSEQSPPTPPTTDILLVDDKPDNLRLLSTMLTEHGYGVRRVINGKLALRAAQASPPDLILLDINMPELSGYEVCTQLKAWDTTREVPVIFISALDEILDKVAAFEAGGVDYITKPFQVEEVLMRVRTHLSLRQLQQELVEQNTRLAQEIRDRQRAEAALQKANQELRRLATLDGLTQIPNRRRFDEFLQDEWERLGELNQPLALILCDIDYFKNYNDYHGHLGGDYCLFRLAQVLGSAASRPPDMAARYGGEEFGIILPNTPADGAEQVAHNLQVEIEGLKLAHPKSEVSDYVTLSMGIACMIPSANFAPTDLIEAADQALYRAKAKGRNTYCVAASCLSV